MGRTAPPETTRRLLSWFAKNRRPLPWRRNRDPYRIWVAEVLLQQTRVAQAIPYYDRFIRAFPNVRALARAPLGDVLKAWEGAGYYARAHHLHAAARLIDRELDGHLPRLPIELQTLPGVGEYIAAAVASIGFDYPVVALESNGLRVAARLFLDRGDPKQGKVRRRLQRQVERLLPADGAGIFNESLMELGETVCLPRKPRCPRCPIRSSCRAFRELADPGVIPMHRAHRPRPHTIGVVVAVERGGRWLVRRRPPESLLGGLWEFPGGKPHRGETLEETAKRELREETGLKAVRLERVGRVRHTYSHFSVDLHVYSARAKGVTKPETESAPLRWVTPREFRRLARPKATIKAVQLLEDRQHHEPRSRQWPREPQTQGPTRRLVR